MNLEKLANKSGWKLEDLKCPKCGGIVFSKINSKNGYSQFICNNTDCDFVDNLED